MTVFFPSGDNFCGVTEERIHLCMHIGELFVSLPSGYNLCVIRNAQLPLRGCSTCIVLTFPIPTTYDLCSVTGAAQTCLHPCVVAVRLLLSATASVSDATGFGSGS